MSTRSNIAIRLEDKDINVELTNKFGDTINSSKRYLQIYCHWDGYPEGVGQDLLNFSEDYDKILQMILEGDHSTVDTSYRGWRGEDWGDIQPVPMDKPECQEEYLYVFEDGIWKLEVYGELVDLEKYLSGELDEDEDEDEEEEEDDE